MKTLKSICSLALLLTLAACARISEPRAVGGEGDICFSVSQNDTRATLFNDEDSFISQTFGVWAWNSSSESIYTNEPVSNTAGVWKPATTKTWPAGSEYTFIAVYPQPVEEDTRLTSLTITADPSELEFTYAEPSTSDEQADLMFAYYKGEGNNAVANLNFTHALSSVMFKIGKIENLTSVNSISLDGVYASGDCSVRTVETEDKQSFSYEDADGASLWIPTGSKKITTSGEAISTFTEGTLLDSDYTFTAIPQNFESQNASLVLNITNILGTTRDVSAPLTEGNLQCGKTTLYTISFNEHVGLSVTDTIVETIKSNLVIQNSGTLKAYVRATISANWCDRDGYVVSFWDEDLTAFSNLPGASWITKTEADGNKIYYYQDPVEPKATIPNPLFTSYLLGKSPVAGAHFEMQILVQAVLYDAEKTNVAAAWGSEIASELNN